MYNANLDSAQPKSDRSVKEALYEWMDIQRSKNSVSVQPDMIESHLEKYKDEFKELIEQVKERKRQKLEKKMLDIHSAMEKRLENDNGMDQQLFEPVQPCTPVKEPSSIERNEKSISKDNALEEVYPSSPVLL